MIPIALPNSGRKAEAATTPSTTCFLYWLQLRGSLGSSLGCGILYFKISIRAEKMGMSARTGLFGPCCLSSVRDWALNSRRECSLLYHELLPATYSSPRCRSSTPYSFSGTFQSCTARGPGVEVLFKAVSPGKNLSSFSSVLYVHLGHPRGRGLHVAFSVAASSSLHDVVQRPT